MKDLKLFTSDLLSTLKQLPIEDHLNYIKKRLHEIEDPNERSIAETLIFIGASTPFASDNTKVIVLIHGIRTFAEWFDLLQSEVKKNSNTEVYFIKYGFFDALRFWFPFFTRSGKIIHAKRELRSIRNKHRTADFIVVAHSFGTYIISKILSTESDIDIKRLLTCGSIIPEDYRWDLLPRPPNSILNDCGIHDIWPIAAKTLSWGYGTSGSFGFNSIHTHDRFFDVGHSGFFNEDFITTYWLPFINDGIIRDSDFIATRPKPSYIKSLLSILPLQWIIVASVLYLAFDKLSVWDIISLSIQ